MRFLWISLLICGLIATTYGEDDKLNEIDTEGDASEKSTETKPKKAKADHGSGTIEDRGRLINLLMDGYDKRNYPTNMTVSFGLSLLSVDIDERKDVLEADTWLKLKWNDKRLQWNTQDFNVGVLRMPPDAVWLPDTSLYNSVDVPGMMQCKHTSTLIYPNGDVLWVPPCHMRAACNVTLWKDPFGPQECFLKFGSWVFDGLSQDLDFYAKEKKTDVSDYRENRKWDLIKNEAVRDVKYYDCCTEPYVSLTFNLTLQRKAPTPSSSPL